MDESDCRLQISVDESDWKQEMESALNELLNLLQDEHTISAYELHSSGLVQTLFSALNVCKLARHLFS